MEVIVYLLSLGKEWPFPDHEFVILLTHVSSTALPVFSATCLTQRHHHLLFITLILKPIYNLFIRFSNIPLSLLSHCHISTNSALHPPLPLRHIVTNFIIPLQPNPSTWRHPQLRHHSSRCQAPTAHITHTQ